MSRRPPRRSSSSSSEALAELEELQAGVNREHDDLRAYIRSLVNLEVTPASSSPQGATTFSVQADFSGSGALVEHVLHIMLEATRNVRRHAHARSAAIRGQTDDRRLVITIDDDGVGFPEGSEPPWSISSRVSEFGGELTLERRERPGGHLLIELPAA